MNDQLNSRGEYIKSTDCSREEQLKQAIEEVAYPMYAKAPNQSEADADYLKDVSFNSMLVAVLTPSILRHADPEIMKQAGWVRDEEWISVEDRLPLTKDSIERIEHCLVFNCDAPKYNQHTFIAVFYKQLMTFVPTDKSYSYLGTITHWKPLPQPPKI